MLSLAIKNAILVTLIILIIHFLFKNIIIERQEEPYHIHTDKTEKEKEPEPIITKPIPEPLPKETFTAPPILLKNNEEELYKYLFQEEVLKPIEKPKLDSESTSLETRKAEADEFDNMIIGKYDGESVMNGGVLMNGISGVNNFSMLYETFSSQI